MLCCMADNVTSTKSLQLANALREARTEREITLTAFAAQLGIDKARLSRIETGKSTKPPTEEEVARILGSLGVNGDRYDAIMAMARGGNPAQWNATTLPEQQLMNGAVVDAETGALSITEGALALIPGLLQSAGYVRAIMSGGTVPRAEIATRVATRLGRSHIINPDQDNPTRLLALIDEAAIRRVVGSPAIMVEQLTYLKKVASWKHADVRVVPFDAGWYPGVSGQFSLIEPRDPGGFPIVYLENRRSGQILHTPEDVAAYRETVDAGLRAAMSPTDTEELIAVVIEEMRKKG